MGALEQGRTGAAFAVLFGFLAILLGVASIAEGELAPITKDDPPAAARIGVNGLDFFHPEQAPADLERLAAAGLPLLRENFWWDDLEPTPGRFDWAPADALMATAAQAGVEVLPIIDYSAGWASSAPTGASDRLSYPPTDPADYARFAGAVAERYGPGGAFWAERPDLDPVPVTAVELWNEPWLDTFWQPQADPEAFAELAVLGARAVEAANADVDVLIDGSARDDVGDEPWIRQVLTARPELIDLVDAYAVHPYTGLEELEQTRRETAALGAVKPLWITEIGWSTATDADGAPLPDAVDEATQAANVTREVPAALDDFDVERVYLYTDTCDPPLPAVDVHDHFGLCRSDGSPKPAWDALVAVAAAH